MKKYRCLFISLFVCMLLLFGCEKTIYRDGLPRESSQALSKFMRSYLLAEDIELNREGDSYIYSERNYTNEVKTINYYQFTEEHLKNYYQELFKTNDVRGTIAELQKSLTLKDSFYNILSDEEKGQLPTIEIAEDNQILIKTEVNERLLDIDLLMEQSGYETSRFIVNIIEVNKDFFVLTLEDVNKRGKKAELYYLIIDRNLSDLVLTQLKREETASLIESRVLEKFYNAFPSVDRNYKVLFNHVDILETKSNKLFKIDNEDYLSNDGKFVYLGGNKKMLEEGKQRIQTIENYIKGNDIYESEFELKYNDIAKKLGLKTSGAGIVRMNYFNQDYIVLSIKFDGIIVGEAGFTNVIIDLQEDKDNPTAYLVDLDLATPVKVR